MGEYKGVTDEREEEKRIEERGGGEERERGERPSPFLLLSPTLLSHSPHLELLSSALRPTFVFVC